VAQTVISAITLAISGGNLSGEGWLPEGKVELRRAALPLYLSTETTPAAIIRADHVYSDFQTRGFFRIGVLPLVVLEGLKLEIKDARQLTEILTTAGDHLAHKGKGKKAVEGRDFAILFEQVKGAEVRARTVRLESGTRWELQTGAVHFADGTSTTFSRAVLIVAGPRAGELSCDTDHGNVRINLLSFYSEKKPLKAHETNPPSL